MKNGSAVGLLHPGSMGAAFAAQLRSQGTPVLWCPIGRSNASRQRAEQAGIEPVDDLGALLDRVDVLLSLCPPAAAEDVAAQVAAHGFRSGTYIEANAITPQRARHIAARLPDAVVVDGCVVGSPPVRGKQPTLYLSGPREHVAKVEELFDGTDVRTHSLGDEIGKASALKLAYSSYQKASRVLAALAYGLADANGVAEELLQIASKRTGSYLTETDYIPKTAARAWRWAPELDDAADLLAESGLPDRFMRETAAVLHRWDDVHDRPLTVTQALELLSTEAADGGDSQPGSQAEE
jgi:3-hydroxyisobutyrate dehydrogenase-like beta-hydroxyacid dehydrogenase